MGTTKGRLEGMQKCAIILIASLFSLGAQARVLSVDLVNTSSIISSSDLIVNQEAGVLHPPLLITGYDDGDAGDSDDDLELDIGDGSDGAFDSSTYANFASEIIAGSPTIIVLDLDTKNEFNFTSFTLDSGYTILPEGDQPLIIRSQGDVVVNGTIDCSGEDGENSVSGSSLQAGGEGRCMGRDGGRGASITENAEAGVDNNIGGSGGGQATNTDSGGGGGGAYNGVGNLADPGLGGNPGGAGTSSEDPEFSDVDGGAGGGGGEDGSDSSSGGGGGAGGGVVLIYAYGDISIGSSGKIHANGGAGGGNSALNAGGGGGGGGGSIAMFSAGQIDNAGEIFVERGAIGDSNSAGTGGLGAVGRLWFTDIDGSITGTGTETFAGYTMAGDGSVVFDTGSFNVEVAEVDLLNTGPTLNGVTATTSLQSGDSLDGDWASYETSGESSLTYNTFSSVVGSSVERFARVRLTLNTTSGSNPSTLTGFDINLTDLETEEFDFVAACGSMGKSSVPPGSGWLIAMPIMLAFIFRWKDRKAVSINTL